MTEIVCVCVCMCVCVCERERENQVSSKVGDLSRGRPEGSLFNSYNMKV